MMNNRERALAILHYQPYDRLPVVHFGFWNELLDKWAEEGHITKDEARLWGDGNEVDYAITARLGFDFNWYTCFHWNYSLRPPFTPQVVRVREDGSREVRNVDGVTILNKDETNAIPMEIEHLLKDRAAFEEHYRARLEWNPDRVPWQWLEKIPAPEQRDHPIGLHCGSLWGRIRDITGLVGLSYMMADDPDLVEDMLDMTGELCYQGVKAILEKYDKFDFIHFWEDIAYRAGPLVSPTFFYKKVGPYYKRITDLGKAHGIDICSLDCDGQIDKLIPTWVDNGVNTMFPIEVGVWGANIAPWRAKYGKELRGVGGVTKTMFGKERAVIDTEIERIKPLVELGGYVPCLDHRIPEDAVWENVQYYCDRMHQVFG